MRQPLIFYKMTEQVLNSQKKYIKFLFTASKIWNYFFPHQIPTSA